MRTEALALLVYILLPRVDMMRGRHSLKAVCARLKYCQNASQFYKWYLRCIACGILFLTRDTIKLLPSSFTTRRMSHLEDMESRLSV